LKGQICEANFYSGELALQQSAKNEAIRLFRLAAADCPKTFEERLAAKAELRALGIDTDPILGGTQQWVPVPRQGETR
jgi:lipoprotein NlpI